MILFVLNKSVFKYYVVKLRVLLALPMLVPGDFRFLESDWVTRRSDCVWAWWRFASCQVSSGRSVNGNSVASPNAC
jgi:hypothetical protein